MNILHLQAALFSFTLLSLPLTGCTPEPRTETASAAQPLLHYNDRQDNILDALPKTTDTPISTVPFPTDTVTPPDTVTATESATLPESCRRYFRQATACFRQQGDDAPHLLRLHEEARQEITAQNPNEQECLALEQSFQELAVHLSCR